MKFLIDECLTADLVKVCNYFGPEASTISALGLVGQKDWEIAKFAADNDWVVVTHNSKDLRGKNYKGGYLLHEKIHPGMISLVAFNNRQLTHINMNEIMQKSLFITALEYIKTHEQYDLLNHVLEVDFDGFEVNIRLYEAPTF